MDRAGNLGYFSDMTQSPAPIPAWQLYGEENVFPDLMHVERIVDRAEGLDWTIAPHRHLHLHQIFHLIAGEIRMTVDGEAWQIAPPVMLNIPRGAAHSFSFSAGTQGFVLTLPADHFPDLFGPQSETAVLLGRAFAVAADAGAADLVAAIAASHGGTDGLRRTRLRGQIVTLICDMLDRAAAHQDVALAPDARVQAFQALVRDTLRARWSMDRYAAALAISPRHLSRLCRRATGLAALDYIETQRIREACNLLVYTRMSVQQVAYHLGYDDPSYFSRCFQRSVGRSPSAYRQGFDG